MTHILRPATSEDAQDIRNLIHLVGINPTGLDWRRFIIASTPQGKMIGCGQVKPHRDGSYELASIATMPDYQGQGIARSIIERLLAENTMPLYLTCRATLGTFYERFSFRIIQPDEMPPYFRRLIRLAGFLTGIGLMKEKLLVMKRDHAYRPKT
jgi:N-acetylglutamate synthase-like GNAT family acetyltransferase